MTAELLFSYSQIAVVTNTESTTHILSIISTFLRSEFGR